MRKLDKSVILSKKYKDWVEELEKNGTDHPEKSNKQYDVVFNLFHIQKGLCAYTELLLCEEQFYDKENWNDEQFNTAMFHKLEYKGELDHFDPELKKQKKFWLWENFFMIDPDVNSAKVKGAKPVDYILKPDLPEYDPFDLLDYDFKTHRYTANTNKPREIQIRIEAMINILGLNFGPIRRIREIEVEDKRKDLEKNNYNFEELEIIQFPTAFEFLKRENAPD